MNIILNDLSFQYKMYSQEEALDKLINFIRLCHEIESGKYKKVKRIALVERPDVQFEIAPGCKIIRLLQRVLPTEERRYLLSILVNRPVSEKTCSFPFEMDGRKSFACTCAGEGAVVSIVSDPLFADSVLSGKIEGEAATVRNIGMDAHIFVYRELLGRRLYRANKEKHKKKRWNTYGKGKTGSPMDLTDEEAQQLLDRAIEFKGRLYGRYHGRDYAFQREQDVYYHGYIDDELGDDVKTELARHVWE